MRSSPRNNCECSYKTHRAAHNRSFVKTLHLKPLSARAPIKPLKLAEAGPPVSVCSGFANYLRSQLLLLAVRLGSLRIDGHPATAL